MLNFAIDPTVLGPFVPSGTELDDHRGVHYASVVGFRFLDTRIFGVAFPFHRHFDELNLRFYVRRKCEGEWRRGVVFIRELVPRRAVALIARMLYGERYLALPMRHHVERGSGLSLSYEWRRSGIWESLKMRATGPASEIAPGSEEEFITEHYWGYTARAGGGTEYQVEHPRWKVWRASESRLDADIAALYGDAFVESLSAKPASAFIADGSPVVVRSASRLVL